MSTRISESFPLPSRERPVDKRSGGPIAEQWEGEGARAESATVARNFPSPLAGEGGDPRSGEGEGARAEIATVPPRREPPHPPVADATGPALSRRGRGETLRTAADSLPLPSRERKGPLAEQWQRDGARAHIAAIAPRRPA